MNTPEGLALSISLLTFFLIMVLTIACAVISFICWGLIGKKCGFNFWLTAILMMLPIANVIMFLFLGFSNKKSNPEKKD